MVLRWTEEPSKRAQSSLSLETSLPRKAGLFMVACGGGGCWKPAPPARGLPCQDAASQRELELRYSPAFSGGERTGRGHHLCDCAESAAHATDSPPCQVPSPALSANQFPRATTYKRTHSKTVARFSIAVFKTPRGLGVRAL